MKNPRVRNAETQLKIINSLEALSDEKLREVEAEIRGYIRGREDERKEN